MTPSKVISVREARASYDDLPKEQKEKLAFLFGYDFKCFNHPEKSCDKLQDPICLQCKINKRGELK